jgi:hypothetical protein
LFFNGLTLGSRRLASRCATNSLKRVRQSLVAWIASP